MTGWRRTAVGLMLGVTALGRTAWASPDYTKKERKKCVYCHDSGWTSGRLTVAGQYFLAHNRSLKGFVPAPVPAHPPGSVPAPAGERPLSRPARPPRRGQFPPQGPAPVRCGPMSG